MSELSSALSFLKPGDDEEGVRKFFAPKPWKEPKIHDPFADMYKGLLRLPTKPTPNDVAIAIAKFERRFGMSPTFKFVPAGVKS